MGGTSRISREAYVRFCERLGVQSPGPTRRSDSRTSAGDRADGGLRTLRQCLNIPTNPLGDRNKTSQIEDDLPKHPAADSFPRSRR